MEEGDLDVLVGGPPCQGFSVNAPVRSEQDERNHLFRHYVRLVLEGLRPKMVVFENVPGLVSMGDTLSSVGDAFAQAGYRVKYKILNAAHYGVPQERWRLLVVGTRLDAVAFSFPEPQYSPNGAPISPAARSTPSATQSALLKQEARHIGLSLEPYVTRSAICLRRERRWCG